MNSWNLIYENFDRVAFSLGNFRVHWYGLCYAFALILGLFAVKFFIARDKFPIPNALLESFFIYAEIGIILGARLGYILIYDADSARYLARPWDIFNPFQNGKFVGISGMSYHGAVVGFILGALLCAWRNKASFLMLMDCAAIALPLGYIFGRIGNFLNKELLGRETDLPFGILVNGRLLHPSQLYEAFLEGLCVFLVLFFVRRKVRFQGELIALYLILYSLARFVCEFFRAPDSQMGFFALNLTAGQILSICSLVFALCFLAVIRAKKIKKRQL